MRSVGFLLLLAFLNTGCGIDTSEKASLTAEESLAVSSARRIVDLPFLANEELHARLTVLEYLGLPYENMADLFMEVEQRIAECMSEKGHSYNPVPGAIASLPLLAYGLSATEYGHFPHLSSTARDIVFEPFDRATTAAIADRGDSSEIYFDELYGTDPDDLAGGCSGDAHKLLGAEGFDSVLNDAATRLVVAVDKDPLAAESVTRFTSCLGSSRDDFLASLHDAVSEAGTPDEQSRVSVDFAAKELRCIETTLRDSDAAVRSRAVLAVQSDHMLAHEICEYMEGLGWEVPAEVAKC